MGSSFARSLLKPALLCHQDRARRQSDERVRRAAHGALEDAAMAVMANDEQIELAFARRGHDRLDLVPLADEGPELDTGESRLVARALGEPAEVVVDLLL